MMLHNSTLWTNIDFSGVERIPSGTIREYVRRSQGKLKSLATNGFHNNQKAVWTDVIRRCRDLQQLDLRSGFTGSTLLSVVSSAHNLKTIILLSRCETSLESAIQILTCCSSLERAEFCLANARSSRSDWSLHLPNLVHLRLDNNSKEFCKLPLSELLARISNIRTLRLRNFNFIEDDHINDFSVLPQLACLDIADCGILSLRLPTSLCEFLAPGVFFWPLHQLHIEFEGHDCPQLVRFSLRGWNVEDHGFLREWLDQIKGHLRQLDLSRSPKITESLYSELIRGGCFDDVEELKLNGCDIGDIPVGLLAEKAHNLTYLDLGRTVVTGVGVKALVTNLKDTLQYLNLDSCTSTSIDAVEFARSIGITVSFNFPDDSRKGKKVRLT